MDRRIVLLVVLPVWIRGDCGFPGEPWMGSVSVNGIGQLPSGESVFAAGAIAEFQCHYKFRLSDAGSFRFCQPDGRWNGTVPQCLENVARSATVSLDQSRREEHKRIALLVNGLINTCGNWLTNGSSLQFDFSRSHRLDGIRFVTRKENSKNLRNAQWILSGWNGNSSRQRLFSDLRSGEFHETDESVTDHGEFCSFYWKLPALAWNSVNVSLVSSLDMPLCEIDIFAFQEHCGQPEVPANGQVTWSPENGAAYSCHSGYQLSGPSSIRNCIEERWQGEQLICHSNSVCAQQPQMSSLVLNVLFGMMSIALVVAACYVRAHYQLGAGDISTRQNSCHCETGASIVYTTQSRPLADELFRAISCPPGRVMPTRDARIQHCFKSFTQ